MIQRNSSTPAFHEFNPDVVKYQRDVIRYMKKTFDYSQGVLEVLLSGSVGSAKSILAAHMGIMHCLQYPNALLLLGRRALPDLKETIFAKICEHLEGTVMKDGTVLREGVHYEIVANIGKIRFCNGSMILSRSWADKKYKKFRSLELSAVIIEELTENDEDDSQAYTEIMMRLGRRPHIKENWILSCTNPDSPDHWVYDRFIQQSHIRRKVFYSVTTDNVFLPKSYIRSLKEDLDPKMAERMVYGKWIAIVGEVIYHAYTKNNFIKSEYEVKQGYPIWVTFDFNIALGKPLSVAMMQEINGIVHIFGEVTIEGLRTLDACSMLAEKGYLDYPEKYFVCGDAAGRAKDTRNNRSDYDLIKSFFGKYERDGRIGDMIDFEMKVPLSNPPIKKRHNTVNAFCMNAVGERRLFIYKGAPMADKGLRLTKLKKGSYIEDDSKDFQHITTSIGYACSMMNIMKKKQKQGSREFD